MKETDFPTQYWIGKDHIRLGLPYMVPAAVIYMLERLLHMHYSILEFGAGGSTLFFAKHCHQVISHETDPVYARMIEQRAKEMLLDGKISLRVMESHELPFAVETCVGRFNVLSVDTGENINRDFIQARTLEVHPEIRIVIQDNYGDEKHWPISAHSSWPCYHGWIPHEVKTFDDPHWRGKGTRILIY